MKDKRKSVRSSHERQLPAIISDPFYASIDEGHEQGGDGAPTNWFTISGTVIIS